MADRMHACFMIPVAWRDPLEALAPFAEEPFALALLSDGSEHGRWSYVARQPVRTFDSLRSLDSALAVEPDSTLQADTPPFRGGAVGLACYEWSATLEPTAPQARAAGWPDLVGGIYDSVLAFDHARGTTWAIGRGRDDAAARARAETALAMLDAPARKPASVHGEFLAVPQTPAYPEAVAEVVRAIGAGEIFQANIARSWTGRLPPGATPFDLLSALTRASPAPFAGYLRLEGRAVVSNSPERFLSVDAERRALAQPIKGTRPRHHSPAQDAALAAELLASPKDRAENLMIVDLMRNDLARACQPGSVTVAALCALESFSNVHHLVSTITGQLRPERSALDLFASAFPPGSVTGAPKLQAMRVIARFEPPRGPYCGSLFWAGLDGAFDASVLIRTVALTPASAAPESRGDWRFETRAGGGIVADSDPESEDAEARTKIAAIRAVLEQA
jgi:para-aminobenzoate synthetase component 1